MNTRRVYKLKAGDLSRLKLSEESLPAPGPGKVQVEVRTIGLNFADVFAIWGLYSATPKEAFIPGLEYSGVITEVGEGVTGCKAGDKVMGVTRFGAYASHLNIEPEYVIPLPVTWTFQEGASYLVQGLTAFYGLMNLGNLQEGHTVLVHSAAGGVGILAGRIARKLGATKTIGTVGNPSKVEFCKKEGYDEVIVRGKDFKTQLIDILKDQKLDLIMECIGGQVLQDGYDLLGPQGRMVIYGSARYARVGDKPNYLRLFWQFMKRPKIDPQQMIESNKGILGFNLIYLYERSALMHELLTEMQKLDLEKPIVGHQFDFENLPEAIRLFQTGNTKGKIVVNVKSEGA
ncbi:MAG: zinc-binding dehydrogenase [Saprospiraceae bacterium]|nr:zinc-binding dehydrogenase [Saprospiraceae bacterium]